MNLDDAERLAVSLMAHHGLHGWRLVFDSAKTRAGVCRFDRKELGLSRSLTALHSREEVTHTVLHEIAHALVGPGHGHDSVWRATARRIGSTGSRCLPQNAPRIEGDWVGTCPAGHRVSAHRRPRRVRACSRCSAVFDPATVFRWTHRGRAAPMHPDYVAELARLAGRRAAASDGARLVASPPTPAAVTLGGPAPQVGDVQVGDVQVGDVVRLRGGGKYGGLVGTVQSRGRTRFTVRTPSGLLTAPFALVEALDRDRMPAERE